MQAPMITVLIFFFLVYATWQIHICIFFLSTCLFEDLVLFSVYNLPCHLVLNVTVLDGNDFD